MYAGSPDGPKLLAPRGRKIRRISLIFPREHGAWAVLLVPYAAGFVAGLRTGAGEPPGGAAPGVAGLLGLGAVLLLHLGRPSAMRLIKRRRAGRVFSAEEASLLIGAALTLLPALLVFLWLALAAGYADVLWLALAAAALGAFHTVYSLRRRERSAGAELAGVALLTLGAPLGFYLGSGFLGTDALRFWLLSGLYFGISIFVVRARIRGAAMSRSRTLSLREKVDLAVKAAAYLLAMAAIAGLLAATGWIPWEALLAFLPATAWSAASLMRIGTALKVTREGIVQTLMSLWFLVVALAVFPVD